jgi:hypothetical protein
MVAMAIRLVPLCRVDVYHPIRKILPLLRDNSCWLVVNFLKRKVACGRGATRGREPIKTILPRRRSCHADKVKRKQFINGIETVT